MVITMQVTIGDGPTPLLTEHEGYYDWVIFQNNSLGDTRWGDDQISATRGMLLRPGGSRDCIGAGTLSDWYVCGTPGSVVDILYEGTR